MASIQERRNKEGKLTSYSIRVHRGRDASGKQLKPYTSSFKVKDTWTEKTARKRAEQFAAEFEKECREGTITDDRQKFEPYCEYVIGLKEQNGGKHRTIQGYRNLCKRIYPAIGHLKLRDIKPVTLNTFYTDLGKDGVNKRTGGGLSAKTIHEYHIVIHTVLEQAVKESLIPFNPADRVTLPRREQKTVNYFEPDTIVAIAEALEQEPIKWKTLTHLYLITGARRGEILGLKWESVDFDNNRIYICNNILYTPERGVYEDTPKTKLSIRWISLPEDTILLLRKYRAWQSERRLLLADYYQNQDFVFSQDNGKPMHPDSITRWMSKFSKRHNLPHINPHAFRHSMATLLFYHHADPVSVQNRLGHSKASTTMNIYAHSIAKADQENADIIASAFLRKENV